MMHGTQVAMAMQPNVFAPAERPAPHHFYVIKNGLVAYGTRMLSAGKMWGEEIVTESLDAFFTARCMTCERESPHTSNERIANDSLEWLCATASALTTVVYHAVSRVRPSADVNVFCISRRALKHVLDGFPDSSLAVRKYAVRLCLRCEIMRIAFHVKLARLAEVLTGSPKHRSFVDRVLQTNVVVPTARKSTTEYSGRSSISAPSEEAEDAEDAEYAEEVRHFRSTPQSTQLVPASGGKGRRGSASGKAGARSADTAMPANKMEKLRHLLSMMQDVLAEQGEEQEEPRDEYEPPVRKPPSQTHTKGDGASVLGLRDRGQRGHAAHGYAATFWNPLGSLGLRRASHGGRRRSSKSSKHKAASSRSCASLTSSLAEHPPVHTEFFCYSNADALDAQGTDGVASKANAASQAFSWLSAEEARLVGTQVDADDTGLHGGSHRRRRRSSLSSKQTASSSPSGASHSATLSLAEVQPTIHSEQLLASEADAATTEALSTSGGAARAGPSVHEPSPGPTTASTVTTVVAANADLPPNLVQRTVTSVTNSMVSTLLAGSGGVERLASLEEDGPT
jgi:hypothetical protein